MQVEPVQQLSRLHGDHDTGAIINRSGAQVPRIQVAGDDYNLFRMLGAFEIGNNVVALSLGALVCGQREMKTDFALRSQTCDQASILGGDCSSWNRRGAAPSCMC